MSSEEERNLAKGLDRIYSIVGRWALTGIASLLAATAVAVSQWSVLQNEVTTLKREAVEWREERQMERESREKLEARLARIEAGQARLAALLEDRLQ